MRDQENIPDRESSCRRPYVPRIRFRLGVAALLAVFLQLLALFFPFGADLPHRILFLVSYPVLFIFVLANVRRPGLVILGIGLVLNFLPIAANGGLMPITPETLARSGGVPEDAEVGHWLEGTKDVLVEREDAHLHFLADRLVVEEIDPPIRAFSIGDVFVAFGLLVTAGEVLLGQFRPTET